MKRGTVKWAKSLGKKWVKKLNRYDVQHLADSQDGTPTLRGLLNNIASAQNAGEEPCRDCLSIAHKLGLALMLVAYAWGATLLYFQFRNRGRDVLDEGGK